MSDSTSPPSAPRQPGAPVRLKVSYRSPQALLGELTRSVGQGRVAIEGRKNLPVGTRFVLELHASGVPTPVEVQVEVEEVIPLGEGKYLLGLRYEAGEDRRGVDAALSRIFAVHELDKIRKHPRIPFHLRANEDVPDAPSYLIRDLSRGGAGVTVDMPALPPEIEAGAPFVLEVEIDTWKLALRGEVAWALAPQAERAVWFNPSFGVSFNALPPEAAQRLEQLLTLSGLPRAPWKARIRVGPEAAAAPRAP